MYNPNGKPKTILGKVIVVILAGLISYAILNSMFGPIPALVVAGVAMLEMYRHRK